MCVLWLGEGLQRMSDFDGLLVGLLVCGVLPTVVLFFGLVLNGLLGRADMED